MIDIVILCGGNGTRLFPLSTAETPKQFLNLVDKKKSMFQITLERGLKINENGHFYIICNQQHLDIVKNDTRHLKHYTIIVEPMGKNTCAPISIVAHMCQSEHFLVLSSDHLWDDELFCQSVLKNVNQNKNISVFGIQPTHPETGYGYLHISGNRLLSFKEKPNLETAKKFVKDGNYLWNSGNFIMNTKFIQTELEKHCRDINEQTKKVLSLSTIQNNVLILTKDEFSKVRSDSIDYAVMEHQTECNVIIYNGLWSDIGSFESLHSILPKDLNNNVFQTDKELITYETTNCFVSSNTKKQICLSNLDNIMIVETDDILYIGDLKKSQNVKKIVEQKNI